MFCIFCGEQNATNAIFCKNCGKEMPIKLEYAGFWIRFGAYFIDYLFLIVLVFVVGIILGIFNLSSNIDGIMDILITYVLWVIYSTFFLTLFSFTPGKKLYGLRVVNEENQRLDFKTAILRSSLQPISLLLFGAGYWNMSKNGKEQAWHDHSVHTIVEVERKLNLIIPVVLSISGIILYLYLSNLK